MRVSVLTLKNFRNAKHLELRPSEKLNFILGPNGQGKTSVLEGLGYASSFKSFRGAKTGEAIRWGEQDAEVRVELRSDTFKQDALETALQIILHQETPGGRATKLALINGKPVRSAASFLLSRFGQMELGIHSIVFNPSDHDLIRGEPIQRRAYWDRAISAQNQDYLKALTQYQKTLEQRNALLKTIRETGRPQREHWLSFTEPLVEWGSLITQIRLQWMAEMLPEVEKKASQIAPLQTRLFFKFLSSWAVESQEFSFNNIELIDSHFAGQRQIPTLEDLERSFWKRIGELEGAETKQGVTLVGPHRDDWGIWMGPQPLKGHGSQGEVRTALLALKLAELELFRRVTGHRPLFLLDDFSSELDRERRNYLMRFLMESDLQVFITATEEPQDAQKLGTCFWLNGDQYGNDSGQNAAFLGSVQRSATDE